MSSKIDILDSWLLVPHYRLIVCTFSIDKKSVFDDKRRLNKSIVDVTIVINVSV